MGKSIEAFKKTLNSALSGYGAVAEFCRKTSFSRPGVEKWLQGESTPTIENLEIIADALGITPWSAIKPENEPFVRPHKLGDCLEIINRAVLASQENPESGNPLPEKLIQLINQLDENKRRNYLEEQERFLSKYLGVQPVSNKKSS